MNLILLIFLALPQDYINLVLDGQYEEAMVYCDQKIEKGKNAYDWTLEKGDLYFAKIGNFNKAVEIYKGAIEDHRKKDGWLYYRLALAYEMNEGFLDAAKAYEIVATKYRKSPLDSFALSGVERCFEKNYQDYVATVNGYNITRLELDKEMSKRMGFGSRDENAVLDGMVLGRLIFENARKYQVDTTSIYKETMTDKRKSLLLEEVYANDVIEEAKPSEREMKKFYKNNKNYLLREEIRGKEIVVESESLATFLLDSLKKHVESFDTLAQIYSTAHSSNSKGNMGIVFKDVRPEPVDKVLFKAKLNELTGIIEFDGKYGIYIVTDHKPERYREYDKVKSQIETQLKAENIKKVEEEFVKNLKKKAKIEMYEGELSQLLESDDDAVAVEINGRKIYKSDVAKKNEAQPEYGRVDISIVEEFEKLLNTMIVDELKLEYGERNKYFLRDGYINKMITAITQACESALYGKIVVEPVTVDSQEIVDSYNEHKKELLVSEMVDCQEVVVENKSLAEDLRKIILATPELFDSLAREHSIANTAKRGGMTGKISRRVRKPIFESVVFKLSDGDMSKVFKNDDGNYTFVKVIEYTPEHYRTLEELWSGIETNLRREKQMELANKFIERIRAEAEIEIFLQPPEVPEETKPDESDKVIEDEADTPK
ncbi:MAG: peptidyl-prolyl cis-trans isomerase [bacterium]